MNFLIPPTLIKRETAKAMFIKIPKKTSGFWVSKKLIKPYKSSYSLYAGEDFSFNDGMISVYELSEMFKLIDSPFETHKPLPLLPKHIDVIDDLKDE